MSEACHAVNLTHVTTYSLRPDHILELVITFEVPKTAAGEQEVGERLRLPFRCFVYGVHDLAGGINKPHPFIYRIHAARPLDHGPR